MWETGQLSYWSRCSARLSRAVWCASPAAAGAFLGCMVGRQLIATLGFWSPWERSLIKQGGMVEFAAGRRWRGWVDAYREDFIARGEAKLTVAFDRPGHICRLDQERLLHGALAGGGSEVPQQ